VSALSLSLSLRDKERLRDRESWAILISTIKAMGEELNFPSFFLTERKVYQIFLSFVY